MAGGSNGGRPDSGSTQPIPKIDEDILKKYESLDEVLGTEDAQAFELSRHLWALKGFVLSIQKLVSKLDRIILNEERKVQSLLARHRIKLSPKQQIKLQEIFNTYAQCTHSPTMRQVFNSTKDTKIKR